MIGAPIPRKLIAPSHKSVGGGSEATPSSAWVLDSVKRFNNLSDRARLGEGRVVPRPPREEAITKHLGPGLHKVVF